MMNLGPFSIRQPYRAGLLSLLLLILPLLWETSVSAQENRIRVGLMEEPKTLNIWLASDTWSGRILSQFYQALYIREPKELKLIPWLAQHDPVHDADSLSYTITLRDVRWSDGTPLTSEDVAFTGKLIQELRVPRFISNWDFIEAIETPDPRTVRFVLKHPKAIFTTRTLTTPIVQKARWHPIVERIRADQAPLASLLNHQVDEPESSGPFVLKEWKKGAYIFLERNPHFFAQGMNVAGYELGPHVEGMVFRTYGTSDAAVLALRRGSVDLFWWGLQPGYIEDLEEDENIEVFTNQRSALYYLGLNLRNKPLDDIHFRKALSVIIDKDFIVERILHDYAIKMDSIIPPGNTFWYYPDVPRYGENLSREDRTREAYEILKNAGYTWRRPPVNDKGEVVEGQRIMLPDGSPMGRMTILTPPADYDPHRAMVGIMVQEWLRMVGIPAVSRPMPLGSLVQQVKTRQKYDCVILGYGSLSLDPDYLRNFFLSANAGPKGWNTSGYNNPRFDRIANESANTLDPEKRQKLIWEMQRMVMEDLPWIPLYCPNLAEGVRTDRFTGWVNMVGGIGNPWSFCQIRLK